MLMLGRLTVLLLINVSAFAQITGARSPIKFDKFIDGKKIQWAAYANNTLTLDKYNLTDDLYKRFQNGKIKISLPISRDSLMQDSKISFINKADLEKLSFPPGITPSDFNLQKPTNRVDSNSALINIEEILYVANGKLHSYIPWISPKISVYTSRDQFIGTAEYFSSCLNTKYKFSPSKKDKLIFINSTKKKILIDSIPHIEMLKQLYGINILEAIWDDIMSDKNEIIDISSGQKTSVKNLQRYNFANSITIPVYDSLGNIIASNNYNLPATPSLFQQIEITQDWFYDYTKNIVTNNITDITLFVRSKSFLDEGVLKPFIKITFK
jgi:hypothetical protein